jgi:hypothetical protein
MPPINAAIALTLGYLAGLAIGDAMLPELPSARRPLRTALLLR